MCIYTHEYTYIYTHEIYICIYSKNRMAARATQKEACSQFHPAANWYNMQHIATHCITLHHIATHGNRLQQIATDCIRLHHIATHCNTLQHIAIHCNTLQHIATHCNTLQHIATFCNTLQHIVYCRLNIFLEPVKSPNLVYYSPYYGVATVSRLLKNMGLFCRISSLL